MRLKCPHCGGTAHIRTSRDLSEITRELSIQCLNVECSHSWVAIIEAVRTIAPSMTPNPAIHIPLSPRVENWRA
ncbi:MAG: Ogr/Delta-like zinc finger protein [Rhodocyclaceae bacterium]